MKKNRYNIFRVCIFLFLISVLFSYKSYGYDYNTNSLKKILIINSYHFDESWEADIFYGIKSILSKDFKHIEYNFEYLDCKSSKVDINEVKKNYAIKFKDDKYDLIIACDDEALNVLNSIYEDIFYGTPVVYTSINNTNLKLNNTLKENSTGVIEEQAIRNTVQIASKLNSNVKNFNFLFDKTETSQIFKDKVESLERNYPGIHFNIIEEDNIDDVIKKLEQGDKNSVNFIYGVYKDENNQILSRSNVVNIIQNNTKFPIYTWVEPYFNKFVIGGAFLEGIKVGELTGTLCYRVLSGEHINTIDYLVAKNFNYKFSYEAMEKYSIKSKYLPSNATVINHPSLLKQIPTEFKATIILIIVILTLVVILLFIKIEYKNELYRQALEYENLRTEFFANISHELRTPLNIILSTLQLYDMNLQNGEIIYKNDIIPKRMDALKQNSRRLLKLINNLIDITKIDSGYFSVEKQNFDIVKIVEDITMSAADYIERKGLNLIFDTNTEEKIMAFDADKIERVILNLLSNAVKFTPVGGFIYVNFYDKEDFVEITVEDTGIGIPKDKQDIIFERFRQVDNLLTRHQEGSGIGLSLTRSLVEMHGGSISVKSEENKGSIFTVRLPVEICNEEEGVKEVYINNHGERINLEFSDIYD